MNSYNSTAKQTNKQKKPTKKQKPNNLIFKMGKKTYVGIFLSFFKVGMFPKKTYT